MNQHWQGRQKLGLQHPAEDSIIIDVETDQGAAASVTFRIFTEFVEVQFQRIGTGFFRRAALRAWLADSSAGELTAGRVTLDADPVGEEDTTIHVSVPAVTRWPLTASQRTALRARVGL
jgi:hypothetical protein